MAMQGMVPGKLKAPKTLTVCTGCGIDFDSDLAPRMIITRDGAYCSSACKNNPVPSLEDGE